MSKITQLNSEMAEDLKTRSINQLKNGFDKFMMKYNSLLGYEEIETAYKKVSTTQEELHKVQHERVGVQLKITQSQDSLTSLNVELQDCRRGDPKYLEMIKKEYEISQTKKNLENKFAILDKNERELFSLLQSRINVLHDKSRIHFRHLGIVTTLLGAFCGIVGASISAHYRHQDITSIQSSMKSEFNNATSRIEREMSSLQASNSLILSKLHHLTAALMAKNSADQKKPKESVQPQVSWMSYLRSKTISIFKYCTWQQQK